MGSSANDIELSWSGPENRGLDVYATHLQQSGGARIVAVADPSEERRELAETIERAFAHAGALGRLRAPLSRHGTERSCSRMWCRTPNEKTAGTAQQLARTLP
jgi:hypothetical protein